MPLSCYTDANPIPRETDISFADSPDPRPISPRCQSQKTGSVAPALITLTAFHDLRHENNAIS